MSAKRQPARPVAFAHDSERRLAELLDAAGLRWEYEPVEFVLDWDPSGRPRSGFRPDFYLPERHLFIELTTLRQQLVTRKNRKLRRMRELYPDVRVKILYRRDYLELVGTTRLLSLIGEPDRLLPAAESA